MLIFIVFLRFFDNSFSIFVKMEEQVILVDENDTPVGLMEKIEAHEKALLKRAEELATDIPGMRIIGTSSNKVPVMSFLIEGLHPSDIGTLLDQQGIGIRTGHHCAMPLMEYYDIPGTARASFAFYNTLDEVDTLFTALAKIQRMFV